MLPNNILALNKWHKDLNFCQSGEISPNLVTLVDASNSRGEKGFILEIEREIENGKTIFNPLNVHCKQCDRIWQNVTTLAIVYGNFRRASLVFG